MASFQNQTMFRTRGNQFPPVGVVDMTERDSYTDRFHSYRFSTITMKGGNSWKAIGKKTLIILGHPHTPSLCGAIAASFRDAAWRRRPTEFTVWIWRLCVYNDR